MASNHKQTSPSAIAISYLVLLGDLLEQRGINRQTWLSVAELPTDLLEKSGEYLDLDRTSLLVEKAITVSGDPALGTYYGRLLNLNAHGILGFAGLVSPTVETSLKVGFRFLETRSPLLSLTLRKSKDKAIINIQLKTGLSYQLELFAMEAIFNSFGSMSNYLFPDNCPNTTVNTTLKRPDHVHLYADFYKGDVSFNFNQTKNTIEFPIDFLKQSLMSSNSQALKAVKDRMEEQLNEIKQNLSQAHLLLKHLQDWLESSPGYFPTTEQMAEKLNTTPRTLHRKLKQEGFTYSELVDRVRKEKAQEYLTNTKLTVLQISNLLSYNDSSNFARAFKKWTGLSPVNFRKKHAP